MLDLIREIAHTMRNNRLRTVLTGIAVAWGVFMLIVLVGAARGVTNSFMDDMNSRSYNNITVYGGYTTMPYKGYQERRRIELKGSDREAIMNADPAVVSDVTAFASIDTAKISTSLYTLNEGFNAVYPREGEDSYITMIYGRFINDRDMIANRKVMVLHKDKAALLFGDASKAVGNIVKSLGIAWTVVGVYDHPWRSTTFAPYTTYKAVTGNFDKAGRLFVTVEGLEKEEDIERTNQIVRGALAASHQFDPEDRGAVFLWNSFSSYLTGLTANRILLSVVWTLGLLVLLTGIVGVSNIMFVSVRERTHEIGIRRAIGAKPRSILTQVLAESIGITAMFGYIGVFFGMVVLQVIDHFTKDVRGFSNPTVDISMAAEVTLTLIVAGALAGLFPALKAIKVKPVEALRDE